MTAQRCPVCGLEADPKDTTCGACGHRIGPRSSSDTVGLVIAIGIAIVLLALLLAGGAWFNVWID